MQSEILETAYENAQIALKIAEAHWRRTQTVKAFDAVQAMQDALTALSFAIDEQKRQS